VLDQSLVDAAVAAGVELREGLSVQELIGHGDRITGIRGRTKAGSTIAEKGRLVVGADGRHSLVARSVQASEYNTKPPLQGTYLTYWSGVPMEGFEFYPRDYSAVYAWLTNENLALIGVNWTGKDFSAVRADIEGHYLKVLDETVEDVEGALKKQGDLKIEAGDVVIFHTGWLSLWMKEEAGPVHQMLIPQNGIHILENLVTEALAKDNAYEFMFVLTKSKTKGSTGANIAPAAVR
jgi:hypothetical protein